MSYPSLQKVICKKLPRGVSVTKKYVDALRVADSGTLDEIMINCNAMQFVQRQCVGREIGVSTLLYPWTNGREF